jgi:hypothetical protein
LAARQENELKSMKKELENLEEFSVNLRTELDESKIIEKKNLFLKIFSFGNLEKRKNFLGKRNKIFRGKIGNKKNKIFFYLFSVGKFPKRIGIFP